MQHVAAREHALLGSHQRIVDDRARRDRAELDFGGLCDLVFGQQPYAEQQRVARDLPFGPGDRLQFFVDGGDYDRGHPLFAVDRDDRMRKIEGDVKVLQTLHDVAVEPRRIGHQLDDSLDLRALERHSARHDQPDVSAAQNDDLFAGHESVDVDQLLRRTCRKHARRAAAGDVDRPARPFAAAASQDYRLCAVFDKTVLRAHAGDDLVRD